MKAMDISAIIDTYYGGDLAERIYRPMSTTSWAYPSGVGVYAGNEYGVGDLTSIFLGKDDNGEDVYDTAEIHTLVKMGGYEMGADGKYYNSKGESLTYTFTIAGESQDHPAFEMFQTAKAILNSCGFTITVNTDVDALTKLATGALHVWAAAWSSTVDPDMYQVYHKDSNATSVNNWGYDVILNDLTGRYSTELEIINNLSKKIEEGRKTNSKTERTAIYAEALDLVMELAVELPTYQRNDLAVINKNVIDLKTVNRDPKTLVYSGVLGRIWEVNYL
jgi:peptide/nickel transport system substrate-binding protein